MDTRVLAEHAIAIRMTCSNPDVIGRTLTPFAVRADGSEVARELSVHPEELENRLLEQESCRVLRVDGASNPEQVAERLAAEISATGVVPAAVTLPGQAVFLISRDFRTGARNHALVFGESTAPQAGRADCGRRLAGKVAVITGGAQGFGKGLASALAGEGAAVVVADIKEESGRAATMELNERFGDGTALFRPTDVSVLSSIEACVQAACATFGGVDLFIANAGVLRAGSVEEMDEAAFDLVTQVNYKGFFLSVKAVVPFMKLQHRFNPHHYMDIIQINSKSGLQGSNRNFAYAGSKFGGIGLTQSFAMELIPYRIKVNAICPGNYFDGPLWSDPENGLFVQYLRAGKVPGARTIEDVRAHYVSKIPMGRGCLPNDVAKAVLYLHEQEYETGQALPVTGGQIMLA